jgi:hypothetical protein
VCRVTQRDQAAAAGDGSYGVAAGGRREGAEGGGEEVRARRVSVYILFSFPPRMWPQRCLLFDGGGVQVALLIGPSLEDIAQVTGGARLHAARKPPFFPAVSPHRFPL